MFLPNVKHFVKKVLGCTEEEIDEAVVLRIVGDEQPFAGLVIEWDARAILTKKETPFTRVNIVGRVELEERLERNLISQEDYDELKSGDE